MLEIPHNLMTTRRKKKKTEHITNNLSQNPKLKKGNPGIIVYYPNLIIPTPHSPAPTNNPTHTRNPINPKEENNLYPPPNHYPQNPTHTTKEKVKTLSTNHPTTYS
jgi:hypothetical protein